VRYAQPSHFQLILCSVAGSVTVSTTIGAVLYYAIKHPGVYERLVSELRKAQKPSHHLESVPYADLQRMSYL